MFRTSKGLKFVEEDSYEKGCLPETGMSMEIDVEFSGNTKNEVIEKIKDFFNVPQENIQLNACEEKGRVDISVLENVNSEEPSEFEKEQWKKGKINLYSAIYTFKVYQLIEVEL